MVGQGDQSQEDEVRGCPLGGHTGRHSNEEKVDLTPESNHSVSSRVSNFSSPRRSVPQVQVGYSQQSFL